MNNIYLKLSFTSNNDYGDGPCESIPSEVEIVDGNKLIFESEEQLKEKMKTLGWVDLPNLTSKELGVIIARFGLKVVPNKQFTTREGARLKNLYIGDINGYAGSFGVFEGFFELINSYKFKDLALGKKKIVAEIDPESIMTDEEKEKYREIKQKHEAGAAKRAERKKKKEIERARKLLELHSKETDDR